MFVCEFCKQQLSTKTNLKVHQSKAKYCIDIQKSKSRNNYIVNGTIEFHENKCRESCEACKEKDEEIFQLKMELTRLKCESELYSKLFIKEQNFVHEQSIRLVEKSGTTNNIKGKNIITNSLNLSQERLHSIKDTYTINHYERGGIGQADWVIENILKDPNGNIIYKCTDKNRKNFIYQDDKGNIITDIHAKKLKEAIFPVIETKLKEYKKIKYNELAEVDDDENELLEKCSDLYKENREMGAEFDKRLIEKTYV